MHSSWYSVATNRMYVGGIDPIAHLAPPPARNLHSSARITPIVGGEKYIPSPFGHSGRMPLLSKLSIQ